MTRSEFSELLAKKVLIFDGAYGTELYRKNFFVNTNYDNLNLTNPDVISSICQAYIEAGADVLTTNTYSANALHLGRFGLAENMEKINSSAVALARKAAAGKPEILIAGSIGPVPQDSCKSEAVEALQKQLDILQRSGADLIIFETISNLDDFENILALTIPEETAWVASFAFDEEAKLFDGTDFSAVKKRLASTAVPPAAFGINCGTGPDATFEAMQKIVKDIDLPLIIQPGAGVPKKVDNRFMPMTTPEYFTTYAMRYVMLGARAVGGCCGISPEHISDLSRSLKPMAQGEASTVLDVAVSAPVLMNEIPTAEKSGFGKKLAEGKFLKLIELTPPRGIDLESTVQKAIQCREAGFDAINLPDGPRASSRISQVVTAIEIQEKAGIETVIHCCARDRNLISLQSMILGCMAKNLRNILFITGDPPKLGNYPFSSGVFDVDSIGLVKLQKLLNQGVDIGGQPLGNEVQTAIVSGVGADPNAIDMEREYRRLAQKVEAGAEFIITQPVFEPQVLLKFLERIRPLGCPVIAGVWPFASYRNAQFMKTEVPGVVVPDWIMEAMKNAGDKAEQRSEGIRIARKILSEIRDEVRGVATSAPFGNVNTAIEVCQGF